MNIYTVYMHVYIYIYIYIYIHTQWWAVEPDQFCWGARANMAVLKYPKYALVALIPTTSVTIFH